MTEIPRHSTARAPSWAATEGSPFPLGVTWIGHFAPEDKIAPALAALRTGARNAALESPALLADGRWAVYVEWHRDVAEPAALAAITAAAGTAIEPLMDPDAYYVQSVKDQLVNAMIRYSNSMDLRPDEWLTVEARGGAETPNQITQPSTMNLRISGSDLADFFAGRITIMEARKRVRVRGF